MTRRGHPQINRMPIWTLLLIVLVGVGVARVDSCTDMLANSMDSTISSNLTNYQLGQRFTVYSRVSITSLTANMKVPRSAIPYIHDHNSVSNVPGPRRDVGILSTDKATHDFFRPRSFSGAFTLLPGDYWLVLSAPSQDTTISWTDTTTYTPEGSDDSHLVTIHNSCVKIESIGTVENFLVINNRAFSLKITGCSNPSLPNPPQYPSFPPFEAPAATEIITSKRISPSFAPTAPRVALSVADRDDVAEPSIVGVRSSFSQLMRNDIPASVGEYVVRRETDRVSNTTTMVYTANLDSDNETTLVQSFTFFQSATNISFDEFTFNVAQNSIKWSLHLSSSSSSSSSFSQGITLRYTLGSLNNDTPSSTDDLPKVIKRPGVPRDNMTTYYLRLDTVLVMDDEDNKIGDGMNEQLVAIVEVLDIALADGIIVPLIRHDVIAFSGDDHSTEFILELQFSGFTTSLEYDPSIGLGQLLGSDAGNSQGSSGTSTGLIVGVSVGVGVAVLVVVSVLVAGAVLIPLVKRWRQGRINSLEHVNIGRPEDEEDTPQEDEL